MALLQSKLISLWRRLVGKIKHAYKPKLESPTQLGTLSIFKVQFTFVFSLILNFTRNPLLVKTARINQLQAGKCWHFLFGKQNRKLRHFRFTIVFRTPTSPLPEKKAQINQLKAGKFGHILFDEQNIKLSHFEFHHYVQHPLKTPS